MAHVLTGVVVLGEPGGIGVPAAILVVTAEGFEGQSTQAKAVSGSDGQYIIAFEYPYISAWRISAATAAGLIFEERVLDPPGDSQDTYDVLVEFVLPYELEGLELPARPPAAPPRPRVTGRVVDSGGECSLHCLQVLIEARTEASREVFLAIAVARTDKNGRFFTDYPAPAIDDPTTKITEARAIIPGVAAPIPLPVTAAGLLGSDPLLVIDLPEAEHAHEQNGCDCGNAQTPRLPGQQELADASDAYSTDLGAGCVVFNTPNRAIEEFDFWTVVRTSQPSVRMTNSGDPLGEEVRRRDVGRYRIDWDEDPGLYQAANVAHGHLLHFRQTWYADGYSLGDLLYSLPLAPGQKKLVSVVEWERSEQSGRDETTVFTERLNADLQRNRDIAEVITAALSEQARGGSTSSTWGFGVGTGAAGNGSYQGFNFGALLGISGGYSRADSQAWQDSSRNFASSSMNSLRDRVLQAASAMRGIRSTVVNTVSQSESVRAETDVVANNNHCHALTIQYFEVLRHFQMRHELVEVKECVFVPLPMTPFDAEKTLRWRDHLASYLLRPELSGGIDALHRVRTDWSEVPTPLARYADEPVVEVTGEFELEFQAYPPPLPEPGKPADAAAVALEQAASTIIASLFFPPLGAIPGAIVSSASSAVNALKEQRTEQLRYRKFHNDYMPRFAARFVNGLSLVLRRTDGSTVTAKADFTLVSPYRPDRRLLVGFRADVAGVTRAELDTVSVEATAGVPDAVRCLIRSFRADYATTTFGHRLVADSRLDDDLDGPRLVPAGGWPFITFAADSSTADPVRIRTPLGVWERRSPRDEDRRLAARLLDHLNTNLEYYHHAIWWTMDPNRRYLLLDGYLAPRGGGRSLAQVVENKLIGIVGNSLVLPVAPGLRLDPLVRIVGEGGLDAAGLLAYYTPPTPVPPARVSLPTKGVFAEAVMGACNSCERVDDSRYWRWEDDEPPAIEPSSTASRRTDPEEAEPSGYPTPIVSIQNAPEAPPPTDLGKLFELLGREVFRDLAGLEGTQRNAAATYAKNLDAALAFGKEASTLAQQAGMLAAKDKVFSAIDTAEQDGKITQEEAHRLRLGALQKLVGESGDSDAAKKRLEVVDEAGKSGAIDQAKAKELAGTILEDLANRSQPKEPERAAAAKKIADMPVEGVTSVSVGDTKVDGTGSRPAPGKSQISTLRIWIKAFIPGEVEGFTSPRPGHPGESVVHGYPGIGDCFVTDNRTFSADPDASARLHSDIKLDLSGVVPGILEQHHRCGETIEVDCEDGDEEERATASADRMRWTLAAGRTDGLVQLTYRGAAGNPLIALASDIDMYGMILIEPQKRELRFVGAVDDFPAFEMYARADDGPTRTVFRAGPVNDVGPATGLIGDAVRAIDETITL